MGARGTTSFETANGPLLPKYEMADELYRKYVFLSFPPNVPSLISFLIIPATTH